MQGLGHGQPVKQPPHTGLLVFLRVLFVVIGLFSFGLLAWVMLLRLAAVTRRPLDWGVFVAGLAADILTMVLLASDPGDDIHTGRGYLGVILLLAALVGTPIYYLVAEIRHYALQQQAYTAQRAAQAYPFPAPASPYTAAGVPTTPPVPTMPIGPAAPVAPHTPPPVPHHTPVPGPPPATPPPRRPAPTHIEQVRAELDELSDYLRKHDGRRDGHESGR